MGSKELARALKRSISSAECLSPFKRRYHLLTSDSTSYANFLPREILEMILEYLQDDLTAVRSIRLVCKKWKTVARNMQISWNYMRFPSNAPKGQHLINLAHMFPNIRSLKLDSISFPFDGEVRSIFKSLTKLEELHLFPCYCTWEPSLKEIGELPSLKRLSIGVASTIAVTYQIQALSNLTYLHMCVYGEPLPKSSLFDVSALPKLQNLSLSYFWGNAPLPMGIITHSHLQEVCLEGCRLAIAPGELDMPVLRRLSLRRCVLLNMCSLSVLSQLRELVLENNTYHANVLEAMQPEVLHTQLTELCFWGGLSDADLIRCFAVPWPRLRKLAINDQELADSTICNALQNVTSTDVERLDLYRLPRLTDNVISALERFSRLRKLEINDTSISSEGVARLTCLRDLSDLWMSNVSGPAFMSLHVLPLQTIFMYDMHDLRATDVLQFFRLCPTLKALLWEDPQAAKDIRQIPLDADISNDSVSDRSVCLSRRGGYLSSMSLSSSANSTPLPIESPPQKILDSVTGFA